MDKIVLKVDKSEKGGFRGPKEHTECLDGKHIFRNCYIEGDIDFIFGGARPIVFRQL
ncbi:hypothetical protein [Oceanispirochaeta sp.]|uniref:hypothetical protein n=1 Tax=Oceanispirochaeta sp. TaxID=2035350 RepID=UPI00262F718C|nr:hypothetical protein [Oceanispirochaeta sp.]MDA3959089.1 hypothetical protein [Oceanispirochaeta sp.]